MGRCPSHQVFIREFSSSLAMAWKRAINIHSGKPKWGPTDFPSSKLSAQLPPLTITPALCIRHVSLWGSIKLSLWVCHDGKESKVEEEKEKSVRLAASWCPSERNCPALPTICLEVSCIKASTVNANNPCKLCQGHSWDTEFPQCSHIRAHIVHQSVIAARNASLWKGLKSLPQEFSMRYNI